MEDGKVVGLRMIEASYGKWCYFSSFFWQISPILRDFFYSCYSHPQTRSSHAMASSALHTSKHANKHGQCSLRKLRPHSSRPPSHSCSQINQESLSQVTSLFMVGKDSECALSRVSCQGTRILFLVLWDLPAAYPGSFASEAPLYLSKRLQGMPTQSSSQISSWCSSPQRCYEKNI